MTFDSKLFDKKLIFYMTVSASLLLIYAWLTHVHISEEFQPGNGPFFQQNSSESFEQLLQRASFQYKHVNPREELELAIAEKDFRFVAVMGFGVIIPGERFIPRTDIEKYGIKTIPFTSDSIETEQHAQFQMIAEDYAKKYNAILTQYLQKTKE